MTSEPQDLSRAVVSWLEYKSLTGMKGLFSEASLTVPIAEFLSRLPNTEILSEFKHPLFAATSQGRPRQIDFVRRSKRKKGWHAAYECKFENSSLEGIVNDICRLLCLSQSEVSVGSRYFIFAAKSNESKLLIDKKMNVGGAQMYRFEKILLQDVASVNKDNSFTFAELHATQKEAFGQFAKEYKISLPSKVGTRLVGLSQGIDYACGVWRVTSKSGSVLLTSEQILK